MLIMQNRAQRYDISLVYKNFRTFIVALSRKNGAMFCVRLNSSLYIPI